VSAPEHHEVQSFCSTNKGLLALSDWLATHGCSYVAIEATDVYWKPVWHVLEGFFELVLRNAAHILNVPGRKTDMNDATWIADLLTHWLILVEHRFRNNPAFRKCVRDVNFMPPVAIPGATVLRPRVAKPEPALAFTLQQFEDVETASRINRRLNLLGRENQAGFRREVERVIQQVPV
jgi:hypothetical protein